MVGLKISRKQAKPIAAPPSDYGSDFDEETVNELLSQAAEHPGQPRALLDKDFEQDPVLQDAPPALQRTVLLDRSVEQSSSKSNPTTPCALDSPPSGDLRRGPQIEIEYSEVNRSAFSRTCIERSLPLLQLTRLTRSALKQSQLRRRAQQARNAMLLSPLLQLPSNRVKTHARLSSDFARRNRSV
jgi:hypothetical protein